MAAFRRLDLAKRTDLAKPAARCRHGLLALAIVGTTLAPATAQEMPPMGPPAELEELAYRLGTWHTDELEFRQTPDQPWQTTEATMKVEEILGGAAQRSRFSASMMGTELRGESTLTFNRERGEWQNVWVDGMSAYQVMTEGTLKDGTLVLVGDDRYQGQSYRIRDITTRLSDTELEWSMEMSMDGGKTWFTSMRATYQKR